MIEVYADRAEALRRRKNLMWGAALLLGSAYLGRELATGGSMLRVIAAVVIMGALIVPSIERPRAAVTALFMILPFMGIVRHLFLSATGTTSLDPLLLVTSAVALTAYVSLTLNRDMNYSGSGLATLVFLLLAVGLVQVFNPLQGTILIGLTGIMLNLIPIGFFFIGRSIGDEETIDKILRIVMVVGTLAAAYGLSQVLFGFRGFEKAFIQKGGYTALVVGNTIRPFSFFNNAAEYAGYLQIAFTVAFASVLFRPSLRKFWTFAAAGLMAYSGFLIGSRGFVVKCAFAIVVLLAARARRKTLAFAIVVMSVGAYILWVSTAPPVLRIENQKAGIPELVQQQVLALEHPTDSRLSTLPAHFQSGTGGIAYALKRKPWGMGTGITTRAGAKFGGSIYASELDIGDVFLSLGLPGGVLYIAVVLLGITTASRLRRARRDRTSMALWAVLLTTVFAWQNGGNYAVIPLIWFFLGCADIAYVRQKQGVPGEPVAS